MSDALVPPLTARPGHSAGREVAVVFRHELRGFLLSPRTLLPMIIYAGFGVLSMFAFSAIATQMRQKFDEVKQAAPADAQTPDFEAAASKAVGQALEWTGWGNEGDAAEMVRDHVPLVIVFFFAMASYFLPLLVALTSFDQFSELSTRGARFALLRVRRWTYFTGKSLAAVSAVALFLLVMWIVVVAVAISRGGAEGAGYAIKEGLRAWALMCVLALPYLSLTALISSRASPGLAFLSTFGTWIGLSIGGWLVGRYAPPLLVLFPWEHAPRLVSRYTPTLLQGVGALLILGVMGYLLALASVRRRDV
jgi:hypothetical protein